MGGLLLIDRAVGERDDQSAFMPLDLARSHRGRCAEDGVLTVLLAAFAVRMSDLEWRAEGQQ